MSTRPNLKDPEERAAYRRELIRLYRPWRIVGLLIVCAGVVWAFTDHHGWDSTAIGIEIVGWAILIAIVVMRTRYHRRRMKGR